MKRRSVTKNEKWNEHRRYSFREEREEEIREEREAAGKRLFPPDEPYGGNKPAPLLSKEEDDGREFRRLKLLMSDSRRKKET